MSDGLAGGKRRKIELGAGHSSVANAKPIQLDMAKNTTKLLANYYKIASKEQYRKLQAFASKKDPKRFAACRMFFLTGIQRDEVNVKKCSRRGGGGQSINGDSSISSPLMFDSTTSGTAFLDVHPLPL